MKATNSSHFRPLSAQIYNNGLYFPIFLCLFASVIARVTKADYKIIHTLCLPCPASDLKCKQTTDIILIKYH